MKRTLHFNLAKAIKLMLISLMCLPVWGTAVQAQTKRAYVDCVEATGTLIFKYDADKAIGQGYLLNDNADTPQWFTALKKIKKIVIEPSFADVRPTNCSYWFSGRNVEEIEGIEYLNTSEVTSMNRMFAYCTSLKKLNVSKFNTEKVTTFRGMFQGCSSLSSLDVSSFNTENATNMEYMFCSCNELTSLDVSNFNTSNVTNMRLMFEECGKLTSLNISNFNTFSVTDMCGMFHNCSVLKSLDVSSFKTPNVTTMASMFAGCEQLTSLDLSSFDTEKVEDMGHMFSLCNNLKTIYVSDKFVTTNVTDSEYMFGWCEALEGAIKFDENKVDKECANYTDGYFTYKEPTSIKPLIDSENEKPQYFDLQGKRLDKMQHGVNIVKIGGKTVKVVK